MLDRILRVFGFRPIVKIAGKSFDKLSARELADMIEAHLVADTKMFDEGALYEFRLMKYGNAKVEAVRKEVCQIERITRNKGSPDGLQSPDGRKLLAALAERLKSEQ